MPKLLERCANSEKGTITGFYTVLVEGDDLDEPVADNAEGFLDGHIILDRKLAESNHYPAINILKSISRLANKITDADTRKAAGYLRNKMAVYTEAEDLINVGAYAKGSNPEIDEAINKLPEIKKFLIQDVEEKTDINETLKKAMAIAGLFGGNTGI